MRADVGERYELKKAQSRGGSIAQGGTRRASAFSKGVMLIGIISSMRLIKLKNVWRFVYNLAVAKAGREECQVGTKELEVQVNGDLVITEATLNEAGLGRRLRLVVREGEIRVLPEEEESPETILDELAGALGQESATDYDFGLKVGGLYETR